MPAGPEPFGAEAFAAAAGVSRETLDRLRRFDGLLLKWQARVNLIGPATVADRWRRHYLDSAQLAGLAQGATWADLGSGAGFPGLVLAATGVGPVRLHESDLKKATFLGEAIRTLGLDATVEARRIEAAEPRPVDVVTARALAPLPALLGLAARFCHSSTVLLFPKGQDVEPELTEATKYWRMDLDRLPSRSDPKGAILRITRLRRVGES